MEVMNMIWALIAALAVVNIVSFSLMAIDKKRAEKKQWRIKEKTLFLATGLFGGLGGTLGMFLMHHKTKHWYFRLFFPLMLILQVAVLIWLFTVL